MRSWLTVNQSVTATSLPTSLPSSSLQQTTLATFKAPSGLVLARTEQTREPAFLRGLGAPPFLQLGRWPGEVGFVAPDATEVPVGQRIAPLVLEILLRGLGVGEHLVE